MRAQRGATCKRVFSTWIADGEWRWCLERGVAPGEEARSRGMGPARWSCAVRLKEKTSDGQPCATTLTLVTDVAPAGAAELSAVAAAARRGEAGEAPRVSPGLVKSALQKSVRRGKIGAAARAAALLLAEHPAEALRRLVVVSVEDAALHPSTPLACWLMAANAKGYGLPAEARGAMVRYAAELAACAVKDDDVADDAWIADEDGTTSDDDAKAGRRKRRRNTPPTRSIRARTWRRRARGWIPSAGRWCVPYSCARISAACAATWTCSARLR